jgi:hypothetical protein
MQIRESTRITPFDFNLLSGNPVSMRKEPPRYGPFASLALNSRLEGNQTMKTTIAAALLAATAAWAQQSPFQTVCTNATLEGDFGFTVTGMRPAPGGAVEMVVGIAITHFDGNGSLTQTDNIHGSVTGVAAPNRQGTGTYTINADCTGTMKLSNPGSPTLTLAIVVVDDGNEVRTAVMDPTATVTGGAPPQVMVTSNGRRIVTRGPARRGE